MTSVETTLQWIARNPCITLLLLLPLLYLYFTRNHNFWKKRGIPGPRPIPIFGTILEMFYYTGAQMEKVRRAKYGKLYGHFEGNRPVLYVADPELIKLITVKDWHAFVNRRIPIPRENLFRKGLLGLRDERWKSVRSIVSPTFTSGKIRRMLDLMEDCVKGVEQNLENAAKSKSEVQLKTLFGAYTMDVIARCAFATKTDAHTNPDDPFLKHAYSIAKGKPLNAFMILTFPKAILSLFNIDVFPQDSVRFFKNVSEHLLHKRKDGTEKGTDFLQLLVEAEKSGETLTDHIRDISDGHHVNESHEDLEKYAKHLTSRTATNLTDDEAMAQMFVFFLAGYETTGTLLTYCAYCLATHPEVQEKLYEELIAAFGERDDLTHEDINKIDYLNAVISETLRLYTPIRALDREANEDYTLGDTGVVIPKGTVIQLGFYTVHHDEENFPEPYAFKPERFLKENLDQIKPYTYIPFGAGPRNCIGMRFALSESKLLLCKLLRKFKFVRTKHTPVPLKFVFHPVLLQSEGTVVGVEKR